MTCCMAEKYGWCKDIEETIKGPDGKDYCIFHAPLDREDGKKTLFLNKSIDTIINNSKEVCNLSGTIFNLDTKINLHKNLRKIDISNTISPYRTSITSGHDLFLISTNSHLNKLFISQTTGSKTHICIADSKINTIHIDNSTIEDLYIKNIRYVQAIFLSQLKTNYIHIGRINCDTSSIYLENIHSIGTIILHDITSVETNINSSTLGRHTELDTIKSKKISISRVATENNIIIKNTYLDSFEYDCAPLEKISFVSCIWPKNKKRNTILNTSSALENIINTEQTTQDISSTENIFRRLKKIALADNNPPLASDWHYGEKLMLEKRLWAEAPALTWLTLRIYRITSDYGESPEKALWVLLSFLLLFPLAFSLVTCDYTFPIDSSDIKTLTSNMLNYIPFASRAPDTKELEPLRYLEIFWQTVITIQAAITGLAFRNKFRR